MPLDWNEGFKIGVEKVDRQHKEIFKQVNKFIEFNEEVEDEEKLRDKLEELFYFLTDYVITHFKTEKISDELLEWLIKHVKGETNEIRRHLAK